MDRHTFAARLALQTCALMLLAACSSRGVQSTAGVADRIASQPLDAAPPGFPTVCEPGEVEVMLLGVYHFEGSQRDAVSGGPQDYSNHARQAELDDLIARLARWKPEQIAVEWPLSFADSTSALFARYVAAGGKSTSQNEVVQIGFRLARRLGHSTVYPIDYQMPIGNDSLGALLARRPDLQRRADSIVAALRTESDSGERASATLSIVARLRQANETPALHAGNSGSMFGSWLAAGEGTNLGGPRLLARWYERNFYMAHNLTRGLLSDTRRVLVVVGSSHVPPLRNILDESPQFCPVSPLTLLW